MVKTLEEFPQTENVIQIPGTTDSSLICAETGKVRTPIYSGDPSELLSKYASHCQDVLSGQDRLRFCFEGESFLNGKTIGIFDGYKYGNRSLKSYSVQGYECKKKNNETLYYSMEANYFCDNTVSKSTPSFPSFWVDPDCRVNVYVSVQQLCKHVDFSNERVVTVKCIPQNVYEGMPFK